MALHPRYKGANYLDSSDYKAILYVNVGGYDLGIDWDLGIPDQDHLYCYVTCPCGFAPVYANEMCIYDYSHNPSPGSKYMYRNCIHADIAIDVARAAHIYFKQFKILMPFREYMESVFPRSEVK